MAELAFRAALAAVRVRGVIAPYVSKIIVDEVDEAVWIDSSVDLLDDCAFDLVAHFERFRVVGMELSGGGDLGCRVACQIWKNRILWLNEGDTGRRRRSHRHCSC